MPVRVLRSLPRWLATLLLLGYLYATTGCASWTTPVSKPTPRPARNTVSKPAPKPASSQAKTPIRPKAKTAPSTPVRAPVTPTAPAQEEDDDGTVF